MWGNLKRQIKQWRSVWITTITVAIVIILLRLTGTLQLLEWVRLDQMFRMRPPEPADPRIVLVTINESDINALGDWPMSDAVLARLLDQVRQQQPRAIGLDIFRNLPVEPGHQELVEVLTSTPNLIGIEKVIRGAAGEEINAPPSLSQRHQVAAVDLLLDADGRIRRTLVYLNQDNRPIFGLGAKLALMYLEVDGITPKILNQRKLQFQLGQAVLSPLQSNDGGYVNVDNGGYQILANFRRLPHGFHTISMGDVLRGQLPADLMRDRIVLIGLTADSLEDRFYTSFSTNSGTAQAGVEVHAQVASQLLSAALDGRSLLKPWTEPLEWLWILLWSGIGAVWGWSSRFPQRTLLGLLLLSAGLMGSTYLLFLMGEWVIVVAPLLALISAVTISSGWQLWRNLNLSHQQLALYTQTLEQQVRDRTLRLQQVSDQLLEQNTQLGNEVEERKRVESALRQKEATNRAIISTIPDLLIRMDRQGNYLGFFTNGNLKLYNPQKERVGANIYAVVPRAIAEERMKYVEKALQTRELQIFENQVIADGVTYYQETRIAANGDNEVLIIVRDFSDRKLAEEASILEERNRMAREIHDTLAQAFTGIIVHLEAAFLKTQTDPQTAQDCIRTGSELARFGLAEARRSVQALRPQLLEDGDLYTALHRLTVQLFSYSQTQILCEQHGEPYPLSLEVETNLLRIGQEALTNAAKYAKATEIQIDLVYEPTECILRIKDNGQGFAINRSLVNTGFGLLGMTERAERIGAYLTIQSAPGDGTEIVVSVNHE
jgi:CHASE2 domain-containing sensor protein